MILIVVNKTTIIPFTLYLIMVSVLHAELDTRGISILHIKDAIVINKESETLHLELCAIRIWIIKFESMQLTTLF